jgi:hypothetical protein
VIVVEGYEEVYDQETAAEQEVTESAESEPSETEAVETEPEESDQEEPGSEEDGADPEEETGEEQTETESVEDGSGESQEETESVSGNDIVIKGDVVVFPEGYEPVVSEVESALEDTEAIVQAIETQNDIIKAGSACTVFMLGVLAGAMIIAGFRLRRV